MNCSTEMIGEVPARAGSSTIPIRMNPNIFRGELMACFESPGVSEQIYRRNRASDSIDYQRDSQRDCQSLRVKVFKHSGQLIYRIAFGVNSIRSERSTRLSTRPSTRFAIRS